MEYTCMKCGHQWLTRIRTIPKSCPNCKSYRWANTKCVSCDVDEPTRKICRACQRNDTEEGK